MTAGSGHSALFCAPASYRSNDPEFDQGLAQGRIFNELNGVKAIAGASQGAVISPLLSNVYLHQVDLNLTGQKYALVRYADNMVICCRRKADAEQALAAGAKALQQVKLELNPYKSLFLHISHVSKKSHICPSPLPPFPEGRGELEILVCFSAALPPKNTPKFFNAPPPQGGGGAGGGGPKVIECTCPTYV